MSSSRNRRILMLLENNPYRQDTRVKQEAQTLHHAGYRVTVVSPKVDSSDPSRTVVDGIRVYQFRPAGGGGGFVGYVWEFGYSTVMMFLLSLVVWIREGIDVVHAHNPPETLFVIGAFFKVFGKRFVFDHHDASPEMYVARYGSRAQPLVRRVLEKLERLTFATADHVIATNDSHKAIALGRGGMGSSDVTIVRNGPIVGDLVEMDPDPELRSRASTIIGYVGIMGPQDGVDHLLDAMDHLIRDLGREDVFCVLIGKGDSIPDLKDHAERLGISDRVMFAGWIADKTELYRLLTAVDICVDPDPSNPYNDGCTMIKIMEYMALERPIVAFDLPEHRVSAGEAAVYVKDNDAMAMAHRIAELMDSPDRRSRMGKIGRKRVESSLSWEHQQPNLLMAYEAIGRTSS